ncbi:MAG: polyprenyl synthetase family protein, partial [Oscillospiraceae bacterium]
MKDFYYDAVYQTDLDLVNDKLVHFLSEHGEQTSVVSQAMKYSIVNGGKRLRPILALEFCRACGQKPERALPFACALEFIHSTSLIQDDLPTMDNAPTRRGRASCHVEFGESVAILASDALSVMAFEVIISQANINKFAALKAAQALVSAVGIDGLVGGQTLDIINENNPVDLTALKKIYIMKTETLFEAAAEMGCIAAGAGSKKAAAAKKYAENIGLAFQIVDDILDITSSHELLGKVPLGDIERKKTTFPSLIGVD